MPRQPRLFVDGLYHLSSHASDRRYLFVNDDDRIGFLGRLAVVLERCQLPLVAYTLMGNHYHLVLFTPDGRVSAALQQLHARTRVRTTAIAAVARTCSEPISSHASSQATTICWAPAAT